MAKNNKYASINFNHIYDNKPITTTKTNNASKNPSLSSSSSFSSASYSAVSAPNKHGRILVLTRPTPKPISHPTPPAQSQQSKPNPIQAPVSSDRPRSQPGPDSISLRPLGRTGSLSSGLLPNPVLNGEKEKSLPVKSGKFVPPHLRPGFVPREECLRENLRPKSGGNERMRKVSGSDTGFGNRPNSSG
ncbi:hypothetical protein MtrunA17_Chr2g0325031 [Medicago truncatula]|uniref:Proteophosphoglycan-like protein, putative n=1 Tax=Medicago truncatula TaxID=3880 RepID=I3T574_MEDTR|nr:uncharacterized protein LOC25487716 [Medicago truncatula]XP_024632537.1 uncharacterized protein LOC25487716 [Medicago truncatula]AFK47666.1 unknown [Medicago truncatula]KEH39202.1 proteophosphoglycan-like protein, putative [Medicago truncatula]RHN75786.1 hypothetical protein MtrunA17_Chr2g0325031 [Medicago truncatula]